MSNLFIVNYNNSKHVFIHMQMNYIKKRTSTCILMLSVLLPVWQHPYVNLFKHYNISEWKRCAKEGEVAPVMVGLFSHESCIEIVYNCL